MRLYNLAAISLWHDEAFSALLIKYPWGEMMQRIAADVHPPFYYIVLRFWDYAFGDSLFALRAFSVFFGLLTIWFVYLFVKKAFVSERLALLSALLISVNPFQIQFSQEARMYTLGSFLIVLSSFILLYAFERKSYFWWLAYGIAAGLALQTHYFLMFSVAAQGVFALVWLFVKSWRNINFAGAIKRVFVGFGAAVLVFAPYIPTFLKQFSQVQDNYWIPRMSYLSVPDTLWKMFGNWDVWALNFSYNAFLWLFGALSLFVLLFILLSKEYWGSGKWFVAISFLVPFLLAVALSYKRSLYLNRYFIFAGIFYMVIWAIFLVLTYSKRKNVFYALTSVVVAMSIFFYFDNWYNISPSGHPGMAGAAGYLNQQVQAEDKIYINSTFVYFTFKYYNQTGKKPLLISPGTYDVRQMVHFSGNALLNNDDLVPDLGKSVQRGDKVWVLWTSGFGSDKPTTPGGWREIGEAGFEDARARGWIVATLYEID